MFAKLIHYFLYRNITTECVSKKDDDFEKKIKDINDSGFSPENGRQSILSSTEWELNCMENKLKKIINGANFIFKTKNSMNTVSTQMDFSENDEKKMFKQNLDKYIEQKKNINNTN
jgi:hypothetical protein